MLCHGMKHWELRHASPLASGFCGGGGKSSSKSSSTTYNTDKRFVVDQGIGISADSSSVGLTFAPTTYATDFGAVAAALEANKASAQAALSAMTQAVSTAQSGASHSQDLAADLANRALDLTETSSRHTLDTFGKALTFADNVLTLNRRGTELVQDAYRDVGDLAAGNRTLAQTGIIVAGVAAVALFAARRG